MVVSSSKIQHFSPWNVLGNVTFRGPKFHFSWHGWGWRCSRSCLPCLAFGWKDDGLSVPLSAYYQHLRKSFFAPPKRHQNCRKCWRLCALCFALLFFFAWNLPRILRCPQMPPDAQHVELSLELKETESFRLWIQQGSDPTVFFRLVKSEHHIDQTWGCFEPPMTP